MTKRSVLISTLLVLTLPACGGVAPELASEPLPEPSSVQFVTTTIPPPTYTPLPPSPTATQVVVTEITEITQASDPEPTATPTKSPELEPTATPTPEPDWLNYYGRTADNLVFLGNPNAPVTLIDFSDFM